MASQQVITQSLSKYHKPKVASQASLVLLVEFRRSQISITHFISPVVSKPARHLLWVYRKAPACHRKEIRHHHEGVMSYGGDIHDHLKREERKQIRLLVNATLIFEIELDKWT